MAIEALIQTKMKIGLIGLDTSHVAHFGAQFNDPANAHYLPGFRITAAFPGGTPRIPKSASQVEKYSTLLRDQYGVEMVESIAALKERCDAFLLTSIDAGQHLEQFRAVASPGKPVFIDKPFAHSRCEAEAIFTHAREMGVPLMTTSALRYEKTFSNALEQAAQLGPVVGCDIYGPLVMAEGANGFFWYGIHTGEMLFRAMGSGYEGVELLSLPDADLFSVRFSGGRVGSIRGTRVPHFAFGGTLHTPGGAVPFCAPEDSAFYLELAKHLTEFLRTGVNPIPAEETLDLITMLEEAEALRMAQTA